MTALIEQSRAGKGMCREKSRRRKSSLACLRQWLAEGKAILAEGIAERAGDIDLVMINGYGFPAHRGGPMFVAG